MKKAKVAIITAYWLVLVFLAAFFAYKWFTQSLQNRFEEIEVIAWAERAAALEARSDFRVGTLRLYEVVDSDHEPDSRARKLRQEGEFEIISYGVYSGMGSLHVKRSHIYVREYNTTMKRLHDNPDELDADYWGGHPFEDATEPTE